MNRLSMAFNLLVGCVLLSPAPSLGLVPAILDDTFGYQLAGSANVSIWWCSSTYKVGRNRALPTQWGTKVGISAARNEYEPFQIVLKPDTVLSNVTVTVSDFVGLGSLSDVISSTNVEILLVEYVPVIEPTPADEEAIPGDWPDPLPPLTNTVTLAGSVNQPFWFNVYVPKDTPPGDYEAVVTFAAEGAASLDVTVRLHVYGFGLSDVTHTDTAFYADILAMWHLTYATDAKREVWDLYMQDSRKHRIVPQAAHMYDYITWQEFNGEYVFDFSRFDAAMTRYLDEFGFTSFNLYNRSHGVLPPTTLAGYAAYTPEYQIQLNKLLGGIMQHLREKGWSDKAYVYEYDELQPNQYPILIDWMDAVQEAAPDLRRLYTQLLPYQAQLAGEVDIWVPILRTATASQYQLRKQYGEELWWYIAVNSRTPYFNRFIDHPAINTRIHYWAMERYGITGDLYWACNFGWILVNPWQEARVTPVLESSGDGSLYYPPTRTKPTQPVVAPPISSIRWELLREGLEDAEYFWLLKQRVADAELRLGPNHPAVLAAYDAYDAAMALVPNLTAYTRDVGLLSDSRENIALAIEGLSDGTPFFVRSPNSKAVEAGGTVKLYSEALGWPVPEYQWQLDGYALPGETNSVLVLTNCGPAELGRYTVVASNSAGTAISDAAVLGGYWSELPDIIRQPESVIQHEEGAKVVLVVTAVSTNAMTYHWLRNGQPVSEVVATNTTLLLTNLNATTSGDYSVIVSNSAGAVTSDISRVTMLWSPHTENLISSGDTWSYHDEGIDLGSLWRNVGFDDSAWKQGGAPLGFGNSNEVTVVAGNSDSKPTTVYFRKALVLPEASASTVSGQFRADDGLVVYLNGDEVFRYNMPEGDIAYGTSAASAIPDGAEEAAWIPFSVPTSSWVEGTNMLAAEVHQYTGGIDLSTELVSFWTLDETNVPWTDSVGSNDFHAVGTGLDSGPGAVGGCVTGTTSSSWLEAPDSPELRYSGPFTVGGWFNIPSLMSQQATCMEKDGEFRMYYTGSGINRYRFNVGGLEIQDTTSIHLGTWHFLVAWYDGTNASIQMNNGNVYSTPAPAPVPTSNPLQVLRIGAASGALAGDELFYYNRVLSDTERADIYNTGLRSVLGPVALDLSFDLEAGTELIQRPVFVEQPSSQMRWEGQNAAFRGEAVSKTSVAYQWTFNSMPIPGATGPLLVLSGTSSNDVGQYVLQAYNTGGTSDSDSASLDVLTWPVLTSRWSGTNSGYEFLVPSNPGYWNVLTSSNLVDWSILGTVPPSSEPVLIIDENATNEPVRFYKLELR